MHKNLLGFLFWVLLHQNLFAAIFLRSESGQWFYIDESPVLDCFVFTSENAGNLFKYSPSAPSEATKDIKGFALEVRTTADVDVYELWAVSEDTTIQVVKLSALGADFFRERQQTLKIYKAKAHPLELRETPEGGYEVWNVAKNEKQFSLTEKAGKRFKENPETLGEAMSIEP